MAEWSKAPDSRLGLAPLKGVSARLLVLTEGRGSNPLPDKYFPEKFRFLLYLTYFGHIVTL